MGLVRVRIVFLVDDYAGYEAPGLLGQHGLSVYIEAEDEREEIHRILFDFGQDGEVILRNAELLGIKLEEVEALVLSHSHYDHSGGLPEIARALKRRGVPLIAHPEILKQAIYLKDGRVRDVGLPYSLREVEELGVRPLLVRDLLEVVPGIYFLGEVPRREPGLACPVEGIYALEDGVRVPHSFLDDTGIALDIDGLGLLVISGCGHSGIANTVLHAEEALGKKVFSVAGGLHLIDAPGEKIREVVEYLRRIGVREVHAGHCTGLEAECAMMREWGEGFRKIHSGYQLVYEAGGR